MRIRFKVMFNNGKIRSYYSPIITYKQAKEQRVKFKDFFDVAFKEGHTGSLCVRDYIIRVSDISNVHMKITW